MALFLVLWALADIGIPGLCADETSGLETHEAMAASLAAPEHTSVCRSKPVPIMVDTIVTSSMPSQPEPVGEDGCWCCCTHIQPTIHFALDVAGPASLLAPTLVDSAPREFSQSVYHPPRS